MFHYERGLFLTEPRLAIDVRRRQPRGFISHAHADHMARHQLALCTPATARLYRHRMGRRETLEMPYGEPLQWGPLRLTTLPAGHCLGSAMLLVEGPDATLLYTGDFKLGPSATSTAAELRTADTLILETTFGDPRYRMMPRREAISMLIELVERTLSDGATPVIHAYVLGKSQEVTRVLSDAGIPVEQHPHVHEVSRIYEECGANLGNYRRYSGRPRSGHAVVVPPRSQRVPPLQGIGPAVTFAVTGWAADQQSRHWLGVDHAIPLSDHADYDELLETVERVEPKQIYCTHGKNEFAARLRDAGFDAVELSEAAQRRLC